MTEDLPAGLHHGFRRPSRRRRWWRLLTPVSAATVLVFSMAGPVIAPMASAAPSCVPAGSSHLTARLILHSGEKFAGSVVAASGCDIGIYVQPGSTGVSIRNVTVSGALDQGILVQDSSHVTIEDSTISGNLVRPDVCPFPPAQPKGPCIVDAKAVELLGTSDSAVIGNTIANNLGEGGIGVFDDGTQSPGTLGQGLPRAAENNRIVHNTVVNNPLGCGIVVSTHVAGEDVTGNEVLDNVVVGNAEGVVVADNMPGTRISGTVVQGNVIADSVAPGVVLNSLAPNDVVSGTLIQGNVVSGNGGLPPFEPLPGYISKPTGVIVVTAALPADAPLGMSAPVQEGLQLVGNTITDESWGIWSTPQNQLTMNGNIFGAGVQQISGVVPPMTAAAVKALPGPGLQPWQVQWLESGGASGLPETS